MLKPATKIRTYAEREHAMHDAWHATCGAASAMVRASGLSMREISRRMGYSEPALASAMHPSREYRNWTIVESALNHLHAHTDDL